MIPGERHPLVSAGLPEWLVDVPMEVAEPTLVPIGDEGKSISAGSLMSALQVDVGTTLGTMSMAPELAQAISEFTENPAWQHFAPEPTRIERTGEDEWTIKIGDHREVLGRADIESKLIEALGDTLAE
ncbi:MAG TPA: hypothetical protein VIH90_07210 [Candidatus Saccharimonadales bacterium]